MSPTEAQKRASAKYQRENISSLACRVKKEQAEKFKEYCIGQGKTSNAVLRDYVLECIGEKAIAHGKAPQRPREAQTATAVQSTPQTHKAAQSVSKEGKEGVPLHTLEQRARRILYKCNAKLRKQKDGSYIIEWEGSNQNFKTFEELVRFLDGLNKEGDPT